MKRLEDWPERFTKTVREWRNRPFQWGQSDCLLLCGAVVWSLTGRDLSAKYVGRYKTARGAVRLLPKGGAAALLDEHFERVLTTKARRGDLILFVDPEDRAFGGAAAPVDESGRRALVFQSESLVSAPLPADGVAWRVG